MDGCEQTGKNWSTHLKYVACKSSIDRSKHCDLACGGVEGTAQPFALSAVSHIMREGRKRHIGHGVKSFIMRPTKGMHMLPRVA